MFYTQILYDQENHGGNIINSVSDALSYDDHTIPTLFYDSKIYGEYFPGGNELCLQHSEKFIKPYYINDFLIIKIKVIQKNTDAKLITLEINIKSKDELIYYAETILKLSLNK